jgi:hypothetical protein
LFLVPAILDKHNGAMVLTLSSCVVNFTVLNDYNILEPLKFSDNCTCRIASFLNKGRFPYQQLTCPIYVTVSGKSIRCHSFKFL